MNKQGYRTPEPEILMLLMLAVNGEMNQADLTAVHEESPLTQLMNAGLVDDGQARICPCPIRSERLRSDSRSGSNSSV
jgi:hypothetical protein